MHNVPHAIRGNPLPTLDINWKTLFTGTKTVDKRVTTAKMKIIGDVLPVPFTIHAIEKEPNILPPTAAITQNIEYPKFNFPIIANCIVELLDVKTTIKFDDEVDIKGCFIISTRTGPAISPPPIPSPVAKTPIKNAIGGI